MCPDSVSVRKLSASCDTLLARMGRNQALMTGQPVGFEPSNGTDLPCASPLLLELCRMCSA